MPNDAQHKTQPPPTVELKLSLPPHGQPVAKGIETRPTQTRRWLDGLPVLDVLNNLSRIHEMLTGLNRSALKTSMRLKLLDIYREPVTYIVQSLSAPRYHLSIPLGARDRNIVEKLASLVNEMAFGYKIVVTDLAGRTSPGEDLAIAVHRAIRHLCLRLFVYYNYYLDSPTGVWNELHQLFSYARGHEFSEASINDDTLKSRNNCSITQLYKQALLLGLAQPYRLPHRMINKVELYLQKWAFLGEITRTANPRRRRCRFLIQTNSDQPGVPCSVVPTGLQTGHFFLNTRPLVRSLHRQLAAIKTGLVPDAGDLGEDFFDDDAAAWLRQSGVAWGAIAARRYTRVAREGECTLAVGLEAVNFYINGGRPFELHKEPEDHHEITLHATAFSTQSQRARPQEARQHPVRLRDDSAGGFGLTSVVSEAIQVQVGDLVAIRPGHEDGPEWEIGLVRWLCQGAHNQLRLGVQKLGPGAKAVGVRPVSTDTGHAEPLRLGLSLPEIDILKQPATVIAPRGIFKDERNLFVEDPEALTMIRTRRLIERTHSLDWFQYQVLDI